MLCVCGYMCKLWCLSMHPCTCSRPLMHLWHLCFTLHRILPSASAHPCVTFLTYSLCLAPYAFFRRSVCQIPLSSVPSLPFLYPLPPFALSYPHAFMYHMCPMYMPRHDLVRSTASLLEGKDFYFAYDLDLTNSLWVCTYVCTCGVGTRDICFFRQ